MAEWRHRARNVIVRSSRVAWIRALLRKACQLGTWIVGRNLASLPGVEAVYVRHSHPRSVTFAPGESDLDLTLVLEDGAAENPVVVRACTDGVNALNRLFYFVWPQDARFVSRRELAQTEGQPGAAEILNAPSRWIRIGGREVRRESQVFSIGNAIALHPEFNGWWLNVLQTHVLTPPRTSLDDNYMRLCFRVAMKNQVYLQVGRGRIPPNEAYLPDSAATGLFADDSELSVLLGDIAHKGFWAQNGEERKARILHRLIAQAALFYRELPMRSDAEWLVLSDGPSAALSEAHRAGLRERFNREGALRSIAESIIIYPTPHWISREYQIDILLHNEVSAAAFVDAVRAVKRSFGGRTFGIGGTNVQLTLLPRSAFEHPCYALGTPFPFLHEHIATFAETLFGPPPRVPAPPSMAERLHWCVRYFLFHRFTMHHRPHYVSKDCNFCQLAAIHLFLKQGAVLTEAGQVRRAYLQSFAKGVEDSVALDYLLRGDGEPLNEMSFAAVLQVQSRAYWSVEALLRAYRGLP